MKPSQHIWSPFAFPALRRIFSEILTASEHRMQLSFLTVHTMHHGTECSVMPCRTHSPKIQSKQKKENCWAVHDGRCMTGSSLFFLLITMQGVCGGGCSKRATQQHAHSHRRATGCTCITGMQHGWAHALQACNTGCTCIKGMQHRVGTCIASRQHGVYMHYRHAILVHVHYRHATKGVRALRACNIGVRALQACNTDTCALRVCNIGAHALEASNTDARALRACNTWGTCITGMQHRYTCITGAQQGCTCITGMQQGCTCIRGSLHATRVHVHISSMCVQTWWEHTKNARHVCAHHACTWRTYRVALPCSMLA